MRLIWRWRCDARMVERRTRQPPYFGLPDDMTGLRVLDVGCAEGFFSFEAERRGASEVISLDFDSECIERFKICAEALGSEVTIRRCIASTNWTQA